jgi:uncharacterized protein with predicted RNA binding PUA domain
VIARRPTPNELAELRSIAEFQFRVPGALLIPDDVYVTISPNTNRVRLVMRNASKYLALRARDYRLNLYIPAGVELNKILPHPYMRVYVKDDYAGFIASGRTLFCKHVLMADPAIRPDDEVLVVDAKGRLLAVGRALVAGWEMVYYKRGGAVKVREGVKRVETN